MPAEAFGDGMRIGGPALDIQLGGEPAVGGYQGFGVHLPGEAEQQCIRAHQRRQRADTVAGRFEHRPDPDLFTLAFEHDAFAVVWMGVQPLGGDIGIVEPESVGVRGALGDERRGEFRWPIGEPEMGDAHGPGIRIPAGDRVQHRIAHLGERVDQAGFAAGGSAVHRCHRCGESSGPASDQAELLRFGEGTVIGHLETTQHPGNPAVRWRRPRHQA